MSNQLPYKVYFVANACSPHVLYWENRTSKHNYDVTILSVHNIKNKLSFDSNVVQLIPQIFSKFFKIIPYLFGGIFIRFYLLGNKKVLLHAHSAAGYGLLAWLSGRPYIVSTYGTEIFNYQTKSKFYFSLIKSILNKAVAVTSSSSEMTHYLTQNFRVDPEKIRVSPPVASPHFFNDIEARTKIREQWGIGSKPCWIINRRVHPLYHTLEVVTAFIAFCSQGGDGFLVVMEGDYDRAYLDEIKKVCASHNQVILIPGFLPQPQLREYLSAADFSISVPESDQSALGVLEPALCGTIPLISDLRSYAIYRDFCLSFSISECYDVTQYEPLFHSSNALYNDGYEQKTEYMARAVKRFTEESVMSMIEELYEYSMASIANKGV